MKPADPTKDGYDFKGWMLDGDVFDFTKTISQNVTLVAIWEEKKEIVTAITYEEDIELLYGATKDSIISQLPTQLILTTSTNQTYNVDVLDIEQLGNIDTETIKEQTILFKLIFSLPEGVLNPNNLAAAVMLK